MIGNDIEVCDQQARNIGSDVEDGDGDVGQLEVGCSDVLTRNLVSFSRTRFVEQWHLTLDHEMRQRAKTYIVGRHIARDWEFCPRVRGCNLLFVQSPDLAYEQRRGGGRVRSIAFLHNLARTIPIVIYECPKQYAKH